MAGVQGNLTDWPFFSGYTSLRNEKCPEIRTYLLGKFSTVQFIFEKGAQKQGTHTCTQ